MTTKKPSKPGHASDKRSINPRPAPAAKKAMASRPKPATVGKTMTMVPAFADRYKLHGKLYLPDIVEASALKEGIEKAKSHIRSVVDEFSSVIMADGHKIGEIELTVSFDVKGVFLGFGIGGATSIKIKIVPSDN